MALLEVSLMRVRMGLRDMLSVRSMGRGILLDRASKSNGKIQEKKGYAGKFPSIVVL